MSLAITNEEIEASLSVFTIGGRAPIGKMEISLLLEAQRKRISDHLKTLLEADKKKLAAINEAIKSRINDDLGVDGMSTVRIVIREELETRIGLLKNIISLL